ncbi:hypothetical protein Poli38472_009314 [Pythium oligandrum]|uniref:Uncharacterized protein n=1 Tax=Pythium oligandrum TaxID=41045 RepID=A0A8K1FMS1_PYTOL|nr:hypothetical protein Poli38472_009314 [Pythium oligandrum]|eukprot:TMW65147.1 hypothetical protein Poli38472_009314 [Pythium oligandrum]
MSLETTMAQTIQDIRHLRSKIEASFERMNQTEALFQHDVTEITSMLARVRAEQEAIALANYEHFQWSAIHVQRLFRGFLARQLHRQLVAVRAALRIQRAFRAMRKRRAERRRRFRIMSKKVLRGLRGVQARETLSHNELLDRVGHNMIIERQWRMAMGVADTESDLIHALYRRKFVRKRLGELFRHIYRIHSAVMYWKRLVPVKGSFFESVLPLEVVVESISECQQSHDQTESAAVAAEDSGSTNAITPLVNTPSQSKKPAGMTSSSHASPRSTPKKSMTREELRRKRREYTQRVLEENLKKEAARQALIEKQRETARAAEEAQRQFELEQRRQRLQQAEALREDLERRGLLAIRDLQAKKDEEIRKEEAVQRRMQDARQRIAQEVLSYETQMLLATKRR